MPYCPFNNKVMIMFRDYCNCNPHYQNGPFCELKTKQNYFLKISVFFLCSYDFII